MPIYFNLVRDPVEKAISEFYYYRSASYIVNERLIQPDFPLPSIDWLEMVKFMPKTAEDFNENAKLSFILVCYILNYFKLHINCYIFRRILKTA